MLFNSYVFLFGFLPCVLVGRWALRTKNLRLLFLTLASWFFYAWWDWRFLPLMLSTTTVDYIAALAIHPTDVARRRNLWLTGSPTLTLGFLVCGLVKKLLLADQLSPHVDALFKHPHQLGFVGAWSAAVGYSLQLYFDFSGYSDMAVGLAWLIGFRFPQNFNSPYKAVNVSDFWRRWHMSLSAWFRDYLFIPLGGSRRGPRRTVVNLVITMFLAGLWHGAAWTFVVWGLVHGVLLGTHGLLRKLGLTPSSVFFNRAVTFLFVVAAFVIFRAPDLGTAG